MTGAEQIQVDRIWDVIEKARVGMMATQFSDGLRRPMRASDGSAARLIFCSPPISA
jgi:hypothetical protein